ncbi:MAG TPA: DNA-directed RNA polymerase subunit alpha C-terminal domain-containing protein [Thermaerobacter sp.]
MDTSRSAPDEQFTRIPLDMLRVPPRVRQALRERGYETVGDLARQPGPELLEARGLGARGLLALVTELARLASDQEYRRAVVERVSQYDPSRFPPPVRSLPVEQLGLSQRAYRALRRAGVRTVEDLVTLGETGLERLRGVGPKSLAEIRRRLEALREGRPLPPPGGAVGEPIAPDLMEDPAPVSVLLLPRRVSTALDRAGIATVGGLASLSREGLRRLRGMGEVGIEAILEACQRYRAERALAAAGPRPLGDWLRELVEPLPERERRVLELRYGLTGEGARELAEIASRWRTTRQWVSVVQGRAVRRARARARLERFQPLVDAVRACVASRGLAGVVELVDALRDNPVVLLPDDPAEAARLTGLLLQVTPGLRRLPGPVWTTAEIAERLPAVAARLAAILREAGEPQFAEALAGRLAAADPAAVGGAGVDVQALVRVALATQEQFARMPDGRYGLAEWRSSRRLRARDYVYRALEQHGAPVHYNELTRMVNELLPDGRRMPATHVLTVLASGEPFRRFDRGIYGLSHWEQAMDATLNDLCLLALAEKGRPVALPELIEAVQRRRRYPRRTVARALNEHPAVLRYARDVFGLGAWLAASPTQATVRTPCYRPRPGNLAAVKGLLTELLAGRVFDTAQVTAYLARWRQRSQARQILEYCRDLGWLAGAGETWTATPLNEAWVRAGQGEQAQLQALAAADPGFAHYLLLGAAFPRVRTARVARNGPAGGDRPGGGEAPALGGTGAPEPGRNGTTRWAKENGEATCGAASLAEGNGGGAAAAARAARLLAARIERRLGRPVEEIPAGELERLRELWMVTSWFEPWLAQLAGGRRALRDLPDDAQALLAEARLWPRGPVHLPAGWLESPATAWAVLADLVAGREGRGVHLGALREFWHQENLSGADWTVVEAELFGLGLWPCEGGDVMRLCMPYRIIASDGSLAARLGLDRDHPVEAARERLERAGVLVALPEGWEDLPVPGWYGVSTSLAVGS